MKAIYINLDPYLAAFAAWLKGGKVGTKPDFQPLPLAVTIPLGEEAAIYIPGNTDGVSAAFDVDGTIVCAYRTGGYDPTDPNPDRIADNVSPNLSAYPGRPDEDYFQQYCVWKIADGTNTVTFEIEDGETTKITDITFTVLVRREQASGPVDLVDFTPPAAAPSAADIKSALVAAGDGALAGVDLGGAIIDASGAGEGHNPTLFFVEIAEDPPLIPIKCDTGATLGAALGADSASA